MNGKWIWYQANSVVCLACDPKTESTSYIIADNDSESENDEDAGSKESAHEDAGKSNDSEEEDKDSENDGKKAEEKETDKDEGNNNSKTSTPLKCSYRKCGKAKLYSMMMSGNCFLAQLCMQEASMHRLCFEHFLSVSAPISGENRCHLLHYCLLLLQV